MQQNAQYIFLQQHIEDCKEKYGEDTLITLVGTKLDHLTKRVVEHKMAKELANKQGFDYSETSAKNELKNQ